MNSYKNLANDLMFGAVAVHEIGQKYGLEFRKNKSGADIRNAIYKATKQGLGKVEFELSMLEVYLKRVLKEIRTPQPVVSSGADQAKVAVECRTLADGALNWAMGHARIMNPMQAIERCETIIKRNGKWSAECADRTGFVVRGEGQTAEIACKRAVAIATFGFTVEVPIGVL